MADSQCEYAYFGRGRQYFNNYMKAISLDQLGRIEEALIDYNKAIEINPHFYDAYYYLGKYYFK